MALHNFTRNLRMFLYSFELPIENLNESLDKPLWIMNSQFYGTFAEYVLKMGFKGQIKSLFQKSESSISKQFVFNFFVCFLC